MFAPHHLQRAEHPLQQLRHRAQSQRRCQAALTFPLLTPQANRGLELFFAATHSAPDQLRTCEEKVVCFAVDHASSRCGSPQLEHALPHHWPTECERARLFLSQSRISLTELKKRVKPRPEVGPARQRLPAFLLGTLSLANQLLASLFQGTCTGRLT